jgi:hypothetical protein
MSRFERWRSSGQIAGGRRSDDSKSVGVERRGLHSEWHEHARAHGLVIGLAQLEFRERDVPTDEARGGCKRVGVLWNSSPKPRVGCIVASTSIAFCGVTSPNSSSHSKS